MLDFQFVITELFKLHFFQHFTSLITKFYFKQNRKCKNISSKLSQGNLVLASHQRLEPETFLWYTCASLTTTRLP